MREFIKETLVEAYKTISTDRYGQVPTFNKRASLFGDRANEVREYCKQNNKELMVLLSYPVGAVWHACNRSPADDPDNTDWHPQYFKDHLKERGILLVDSLPAHVAEFDTFKLSA